MNENNKNTFIIIAVNQLVFGCGLKPLLGGTYFQQANCSTPEFHFSNAHKEEENDNEEDTKCGACGGKSISISTHLDLFSCGVEGKDLYWCFTCGYYVCSSDTTFCTHTSDHDVCKIVNGTERAPPIHVFFANYISCLKY